jgi:Fe-S cluster assembly protein SufB
VLAGVEGARKVAVDAVFDSVSVATTFRKELEAAGVIFRSISEAIREYPELVKRGWARSCRWRQLFRRAQLRGVFRRHVRLHARRRALPDGAVHLFPHQRGEHRPVRAHADRGDKGAYVSYLEGCTAPQRDENQLHAAVVELVALDDAEIKYSTVQNWYPGDARARAASTTSSPSALCQGARSRCRGRRWKPARRSPGNTRPAC